MAASIINDSAEPLDHSRISATASSDAALAAFAQLGALRLNATSCMLSLFSERRQHVVAEAGQLTAIEHGRNADLIHDASLGPLSLSGTAVPREYLVCEHVLDLAAVESHNEKMLPIAVVPDLTQHQRLSQRPYIKEGSMRRFYAGVPLRSPHGIDIGVCCIFDSEPRVGFDAPSQKFLRHLSRLVMSHLESRVSFESYRRNERMVRGLGSMVEGLGSMSRSRHTRDHVGFEDATGKHGSSREGALNRKQQRIQGNLSSSPSPVRPTAAPVQSIDKVEERLKDVLHENSTETLDSEGDIPGHTRPFTNASVEKEGGDSTVELKNLFSRAANIMRESIEVEGALFLDAAITSFGRLVPETQDPPRSLSGSSGDDSMASASDESDHRPVVYVETRD